MDGWRKCVEETGGTSREILSHGTNANGKWGEIGLVGNLVAK